MYSFWTNRVSGRRLRLRIRNIFHLTILMVFIITLIDFILQFIWISTASRTSTEMKNKRSLRDDNVIL